MGFKSCARHANALAGGPVYLATGATDLRRSIDGLSALVRERLDLDPLSGHLFLFRNRRGDRLVTIVERKPYPLTPLR